MYLNEHKVQKLVCTKPGKNSGRAVLRPNYLSTFGGKQVEFVLLDEEYRTKPFQKRKDIEESNFGEQRSVALVVVSRINRGEKSVSHDSRKYTRLQARGNGFLAILKMKYEINYLHYDATVLPHSGASDPVVNQGFWPIHFPCTPRNCKYACGVVQCRRNKKKNTSQGLRPTRAPLGATSRRPEELSCWSGGLSLTRPAVSPRVQHWSPLVEKFAVSLWHECLYNLLDGLQQNGKHQSIPAGHSLLNVSLSTTKEVSWSRSVVQNWFAISCFLRPLSPSTFGRK